MTRSSFYEKKLQKNLSRLNKRRVSFLKDASDPERIHDARTSLRRLDVMFSMLPKKHRKTNGRQFKKYKEFFKSSSRLRDIDVMRARIAVLSPESISLDTQLQRKRSSELRRVMKLARALKPWRVSLDANPDKLESRADKIVEKLSKKIKKDLTLVLSDSHKLEELHSLRIECKKLRYVLESLPPAKAKKSQEKIADVLGQPGNILLLKEVQDKLGGIHDSDITLKYLNRLKSANELAARELSIREQLYQDFVKYARK